MLGHWLSFDFSIAHTASNYWSFRRGCWGTWRINQFLLEVYRRLVLCRSLNGLLFVQGGGKNKARDVLSIVISSNQVHTFNLMWSHNWLICSHKVETSGVWANSSTHWLMWLLMWASRIHRLSHLIHLRDYLTNLNFAHWSAINILFRCVGCLTFSRNCRLFFNITIDVISDIIEGIPCRSGISHRIWIRGNGIGWIDQVVWRFLCFEQQSRILYVFAHHSIIVTWIAHLCVQCASYGKSILIIL